MTGGLIVIRGVLPDGERARGVAFEQQGMKVHGFPSWDFSRARFRKSLPDFRLHQ